MEQWALPSQLQSALWSLNAPSVPSSHTNDISNPPPSRYPGGPTRDPPQLKAQDLEGMLAGLDDGCGGSQWSTQTKRAGRLPSIHPRHAETGAWGAGMGECPFASSFRKRNWPRTCLTGSWAALDVPPWSGDTCEQNCQHPHSPWRAPPCPSLGSCMAFSADLCLYSAEGAKLSSKQTQQA